MVARICQLYPNAVPIYVFESYKDYLQVDIVALNTDDLRAWKGWVESRLRRLTLMIERDTMGKLRCHPYAHENSDPSKHCSHSAFFMGLHRKQGEVVLKGQQFDICWSVDGFRHSMNMYMFWNPGMEINVSHVRRNQIPVYVFPYGYKPKLVSRQPSHDKGAKCEIAKDVDDIVERIKRARLEGSTSRSESS
ncbi:hypothetical protein L1987_45248 [Smallanthus sonchifolius]|uniref:Uncharacterized protein n=1 Tax=Smallanthus sonchifolius TaxID=185202 RepID=A0ACB9GRJ2_9ASTR|nr:hypothetical protein L1987_45248 [Smallanthus sonchifolius]